MTIEQRHEFLVGDHGRDQRFLRHRQEGGVETAADGHWPLGEVGDLFEQRVIHLRHAAELRRHARHLAADALAALRGIGDHLRAAQRFHIGIGVGDPHRLVGHETMAARVPRAVHAEQLGLDHLIAVQHHQPVQRAHEAVVVIAPTHRLGDRQRLDGFGEDFRQQHRQRLADALRHQHEAFALVGGLACQRGDVHALPGGETAQRRRGLAIGIQRRGHGRAQRARFAIGLARCQRLHMHRQAPRRAVVARGAQREAVPRQPGMHGFGQRARQRIHRANRQFLDAQLDQQRLAGGLSHGPPPCASAPETRASRAARRRPRRRRAPARARAGWCAGVR